MAVYTVACPACKAEIPAIAALCKHCGKAFRERTSEEKRRRMALKAESLTSEPVPDIACRLERYVGANWKSHYEAIFLEQLKALERGTAFSGLTWNWSAALVPMWWFFHRGLRSAGFGYLFLAFAIRPVYTITADFPDALRFAAWLYALLHVVSGIVADRLLFREAYKKVTGGNRTVWS